MGVKVTRGEGEGDMCILRLHEHCNLMTDWWWADGCITVCAACAGMEQVTDASMRKLCKAQGWGPIPPKSVDTNRVYPQPRVVVKPSKQRLHEGTPIVDVKCPNCGFTHTTALDGWVALGCPCGTDLARDAGGL